MMKSIYLRYKEIIAPTLFIIAGIVILVVPGFFEFIAKYIAELASNRLAWFGGLLGVGIWTIRKIQEIRENS